MIGLAGGASATDGAFELNRIGVADAREAGQECQVPQVSPAAQARPRSKGFVVSGLAEMNEREWSDFLREVREREFDDNHLDDEERQAVLDEWIRRNPADKEKLTGYLGIDFVDLVLYAGRHGTALQDEAGDAA